MPPLNFRPDLVLTDIAMPAQEGYAAMSAVRTLEATLGNRVPVAR
jgi:CheY-like chemotaxis protein